MYIKSIISQHFDLCVFVLKYIATISLHRSLFCPLSLFICIFHPLLVFTLFFCFLLFSSTVVSPSRLFNLFTPSLSFPVIFLPLQFISEFSFQFHRYNISVSVIYSQHNVAFPSRPITHAHHLHHSANNSPNEAITGHPLPSTEPKYKTT